MCSPSGLDLTHWNLMQGSNKYWKCLWSKQKFRVLDREQLIDLSDVERSAECSEARPPGLKLGPNLVAL